MKLAFYFITADISKYGLDVSRKSHSKNLSAATVRIVAAFPTAEIMDGVKPDGVKQLTSIVKEKGYRITLEFNFSLSTYFALT